MGLPDQGVDHGLGVLARHPDQHHVAGMAFHQRRDLATVTAEQQVTFPVAGHGPVLGLGRPLTDRYRVTDLAQPVVFQRLVA